jgi:hypothetical protein
LICASLGVVVSGAVAEALNVHQWYGKPAYITPNLGIKHPCSGLILQVPTRLLESQYSFEFYCHMAYVVCLIPVAPILLLTGVLGLHFYPLKVRQNSKAAAGFQSLNEPWQVFSCFSQLTSYSHTAIK